MPAKKKTKATKVATKNVVKKASKKIQASAIKTASKKNKMTKKKTTQKTKSKNAPDFNSKPIVLTPQTKTHSEVPIRKSTSNLIAAVRSAQIAQHADHENRYDEVLDRRIIEGMLTNRDDIMTELRREGMSEADILRRSADLGISEALIRQVKGVAADLAGDRSSNRSAPPSLAARNCLQCDRVFLSTGPGNRLCMRCRGGDAGLAVL
jgi:hypothetical protein